MATHANTDLRETVHGLLTETDINAYNSTMHFLYIKYVLGSRQTTEFYGEWDGNDRDSTGIPCRWKQMSRDFHTDM